MEGHPQLKKSSKEKKREYVNHFLKKIENRLEKMLIHSQEEEIEKKFSSLFRLFEKLSMQDEEVLYREAKIYYQIAIYTQKKLFLIRAIKKLQKIQLEILEVSPLFLHLYGQLLISLSRFSKKSEDLEEAITKLAKCATLVETFSSELRSEIYWDLGRAWVYLGEMSLEVHDTRKGVDIYAKAALLNFQTSHFWIDYAEGLYLLSLQTGSLSFLETAIDYLKKAILESDAVNQKASYKRAWKLFLTAKLKLIDMQDGDISSIDSLFFEAIAAIPEELDLWLKWGEFYMLQGWVKKDLSLIEKGLEKLTTPKISTLDPLTFSALLGSGLAMLGLFIDDLRVIKEGEKRIEVAQKLAPKHRDLLYASGLCSLILGLYFSDEKYLKQGASHFNKVRAFNKYDVYYLHGYFESILSIGVLNKDDKYFKKALSINEHLVKLRPNSFIFHYEAGLLLLQYGESNILILKKAVARFQKAMSFKGADLKCLYHYATALDTLGTLSSDSSYFEEGIEILTPMVAEMGSSNLNILYRLTFLYAHLGETTDDVESLYKAIDLFEALAKKKDEDDVFYCGWGYALLNLSYLMNDPVNVEKSHFYRHEAEVKLIKALELGNNEANYHLACLYSLTNKTETALEYLRKSKKADVLPDVEDVEHDEWLENISKTSDFQKFLETLK